MSESQGMDVSQQRQMWHIFTRLTFWGVVGVLVLLALMALFLL